jgi:hypothetical protein
MVEDDPGTWAWVWEKVGVGEGEGVKFAEYVTGFDGVSTSEARGIYKFGLWRPGARGYTPVNITSSDGGSSFAFETEAWTRTM